MSKKFTVYGNGRGVVFVNHGRNVITGPADSTKDAINQLIIAVSGEIYTARSRLHELEGALAQLQVTKADLG